MYISYEIRLLGEHDIRDVEKCMEHLKKEKFDREIFVTPTLKYIETIISGYGKTFGVYSDNILAGFTSIVFPKKGKNNIGHHIQLSDYDLLRVAQIENLYIRPEYRKKGLGKNLLKYSISHIENNNTILLSTISPNNTSSLSIAFELEQKIINLIHIYGVTRYLMFKDYLENHNSIKTNGIIEVNRTNYLKTGELLHAGYEGVTFNKTKDKILFHKDVHI